MTSQGEARKEHWQHFEKRLRLCQQLNISTLVVAGDIQHPLSSTDLQRAHESLLQASDQAEPYGIRLALEFQANAAFANNLQTAAALVANTGRPNLGLCLDLFHFYVGPSKIQDLLQLTNELLFHVQFCDLADTPREIATDSDRILPGDGDIDFPSIIHALHQIGYDGYISLELMNPMIWQISAQQTAEVGMTALRKILGQASMG